MKNTFHFLIAASLVLITLCSCTKLSPIETRITNVSQAIINGDAPALAAMVSYPIDCSYPLRNIEDSTQFVAYFDILFDDSIKNVLRHTQLADWSEFGWRGYSFSYGEYLWLDESSVRINYVSEREKELHERLVDDELSSLHPSLDGNWIPYSCYVDLEDSLLLRVDLTSVSEVTTEAVLVEDSKLDSYEESEEEEDLYDYDSYGHHARLVIYSLGADIREVPNKVVMGKLSIEGSGGFHFLRFKDEDGNIICILPSECILTIDQSDSGENQRRSIKQAYWSDWLGYSK